MAVIRFASDPACQKFFRRHLGTGLIGHVTRAKMIEHNLCEPILMELELRHAVEVRQNQLPRLREALLQSVQIVAVKDVGSWHATSIKRHSVASSSVRGFRVSDSDDVVAALAGLRADGPHVVMLRIPRRFLIYRLKEMANWLLEWQMPHSIRLHLKGKHKDICIVEVRFPDAKHARAFDHQFRDELDF